MVNLSALSVAPYKDGKLMYESPFGKYSVLGFLHENRELVTVSSLISQLNLPEDKLKLTKKQF